VLSAPLVLLDWGIVAFLLGLVVVWCAEKVEGLLGGRGFCWYGGGCGCGGGRGKGGECWRGWWEERVDEEGGSLSKVLWEMIDIPSRITSLSRRRI